MMGFQSIIGQEQIKEHMQNALQMQKISHAYIIHGEKSTGKEFVARVFAMALQCERAVQSLAMNVIPVSRRYLRTSRISFM